MQRILEPGEIQALDATALPRVRLPDRADVFAARARRLRALADGHPIGGYLRVMAMLVDAQHDVLSALPKPVFDEASMLLAQRHGMPIVPAVAASFGPEWRAALSRLVERLAAQVALNETRDGAGRAAQSVPLPPSFAALLEQLRGLRADELDAQATAILEQAFEDVDAGTAPFIYAALQIVWTQRACALAREDMPYLDTPGLCPVCGSPPIASIVRVGGAFDGYRYLECALCATQTHCVRVKCSHCASTKGIAYRSIEGAPEGTQAESCDECHSYRKIFAQSKLFDAEPFVDDLASLALDLMMNEAGYHRPNPHPFLWPAGGDEEEDA
jgi:FdhE protein